MICSFCGHSNFDESTIDEDAFYSLLKDLVLNKGVTTFYSGGYGRFDGYAVRVVGKLKNEFPHISNTIVVAYPTTEHLDRYTESLSKHNADTMYPFEAKVLPRYAILKRNEWMVNKSDIVIAYVNHHLGGGACLALEYAIRKKKQIFNFGSLKTID